MQKLRSGCILPWPWPRSGLHKAKCKGNSWLPLAVCLLELWLHHRTAPKKGWTQYAGRGVRAVGDFVCAP